MDGVTATVNYATEKARISYAGRRRGRRPDRHRGEDRLHRRGAPAARPGAGAATPEAGAAGDARTPNWPPCASGCSSPLVLALPVVLLAMVPALQFDNWQWLSLTLAAPVVVWGGLPFHRAAWTNLRHGAATMDTLVSVGTLAAFGWSLWALFFGDAGMPGMRHGFELTRLPRRRRRPRSTWRSPPASPPSSCSAATWRPAPSGGRARALRALLELGAKDVAVLRGRRARCASRSAQLARRRPLRRTPRREDRHRRHGRRGRLGRRRLAC